MVIVTSGRKSHCELQIWKHYHKYACKLQEIKLQESQLQNIKSKLQEPKSQLKNIYTITIMRTWSCNEVAVMRTKAAILKYNVTITRIKVANVKHTVVTAKNQVVTAKYSPNYENQSRNCKI